MQDRMVIAVHLEHLFQKCNQLLVIRSLLIHLLKLIFYHKITRQGNNFLG